MKYPKNIRCFPSFNALQNTDFMIIMICILAKPSVIIDGITNCDTLYS